MELGSSSREVAVSKLSGTNRLAQKADTSGELGVDSRARIGFDVGEGLENDWIGSINGTGVDKDLPS